MSAVVIFCPPHQRIGGCPRPPFICWLKSFNVRCHRGCQSWRFPFVCLKLVFLCFDVDFGYIFVLVLILIGSTGGVVKHPFAQSTRKKEPNKGAGIDSKGPYCNPSPKQWQGTRRKICGIKTFL